MGRPFKCPYCESSDTTGKGVRKTKTMGVRRIRRCKTCRRKFTPKSQPSVDVAEAPRAGTAAPSQETAQVGASVSETPEDEAP
jgi:hypothetical protein